MRERAPQPASPGRVCNDGSPPRRPRLLVIDDDPTFSPTIAHMLEESGYDVRTASDGESGLELTRSYRPDVVLCDWVMPRMDGVEYCRRVKSDPQLRDTYVALLSARTDARDRVEGLDAGADDYVTKPFEPAELQARVRAGLRLRRLQRELADTQHRLALLEIAATLGHEINNPLTALFGHMELVLQYLERGEPDRMQHHIREAGEVAARIGKVAKRLVELAEPRTTRYLGDLDMLDLK